MTLSDYIHTPAEDKSYLTARHHELYIMLGTEPANREALRVEKMHIEHVWHTHPELDGRHTTKEEYTMINAHWEPIELMLDAPEPMWYDNLRFDTVGYAPEVFTTPMSIAAPEKELVYTSFEGECDGDTYCGDTYCERCLTETGYYEVFTMSTPTQTCPWCDEPGETYMCEGRFVTTCYEHRI